ncbi:OsmC family peroxiredoxin [Streptoalloteichus hindustanus]|uniref:Osmotically inducible protein OsmC n=1 Tax=Streptoalloteichus hindustanus TaxID=2017 RepID=A0A1M4Y5M6_STRHI|nr:OsmC family peroxiredoxin [Streptoalloteichus hindustanus]SHF01005.1 osmotically inducible protein OsmC [Streptoalloteichus hindustanus]
MTIRTAHTVWEGGLQDGSGTVSFDSSGIGSHEVTWPSRANEPEGRTSPEELLAAAHSACYSMALAHELGGRGVRLESVETRAEVTFVPGQGITGIELRARASVPGMSTQDFAAAAETAEKNCPVSQALAGTTIRLRAELVSGGTP